MAGSSGKSELRGGMIIPPTHLELNVVDHCNIACRACNHASPIMPAWFADPETVQRDYAVLAKYYRPAFIKVLGGEPLMHKHLDLVIEAARSTGISDHFTLTTNGTLLHKASAAVWAAVDEVDISVYPGVEGIEDNVRLARDKAREFGKKLTVFYYDRFRATFSLRGTADRDLIAKVYAACKIANLWGCHTVREGYFYKCPQSIYVALLAGRAPEADGIAIVDGPSFQADLLAYINNPEPLAACANCAGTVGVQEPHALLPRKEWRVHIDITSEEAIDHDWLERSLTTRELSDDCKIPVRLKRPGLLERLPLLRRALRVVMPSASNPMKLRMDKRLLRQRAEGACDGADPRQEQGK